MKSAYELAMERLEKESGPSKKLTDEQKASIADIEELNTIKAELADKMTALEEERDKEKDRVWNAE